MKFLFANPEGMSSSLLTIKMKQTASNESVDLEIDTQSILTTTDMNQYDCIILPPSQSVLLKEIKDKYQIPVILVNVRDYGLLNGEHIYHQAIEEMKKDPEVSPIKNVLKKFK